MAAILATSQGVPAFPKKKIQLRVKKKRLKICRNQLYLFILAKTTTETKAGKVVDLRLTIL